MYLISNILYFLHCLTVNEHHFSSWKKKKICIQRLLRLPKKKKDICLSLAPQEETMSHAKVRGGFLKSQPHRHLDYKYKSRTILLVILSFYKCCEEGKLAGAHLTPVAQRLGNQTCLRPTKLSGAFLEHCTLQTLRCLVISSQELPHQTAVATGNDFR